MFCKYSLRFDTEQEQLYIKTVAKNNLFYWRLALSVFAVLFALFSLLDVLLIEAEYLRLFLTMRFGIVLPVFFITIGLTFTAFFKRYYESILLGNFIVGGIAIATMLILSPETTAYYGGLFLVLFSGLLLLRIRIQYAMTGAMSILVYLLFGWILFTGLALPQIAAIIFYFAAVLIGGFGLYNLEKFMRETFHYEMQLLDERDALTSRVNAQLKDVHRAQTSTILALSKLVESRDIVTGEHIENVSSLVGQITQALPDEMFENETVPKSVYVDIIRNACALHDIGKVGIPDHILNKPGPLSEEERRIMKKHVIIGYQTLSKVREQYPDNAFINMGCDIALYHHERIDGKGYPNGLKGNEIPLSAKIMALVDVYDALISKRPYKEAWTHEKTLQTIQAGRGSQFDATIVDAFLNVIKEKKNAL